MPDKQFVSGVELQQGLRDEDPDGSLPPTRPPGRIARTLAKMWHGLPTRGTWLLLALWILLGGASALIAGAYLTPYVDSRRHVAILAGALSFALPVFLVPRPGREPILWGIVLNTFLLTGAALLTRPTLAALDAHGDWAEQLLSPEKNASLSARTIRFGVSGLRAALGLVPIATLEEAFGTLQSPPLQPTLPSQASPGTEATAVDPVADVSRVERVNNPIQIPPLDPDAPYWAEKVAEPDAVTVTGQERNLFERINLERNKRGLVSLPLRSDLCRLAQQHSHAMMQDGFFRHEDPHLGGPVERVKSVMIQTAKVAELIGRTEHANDIAKELLAGWMRSSPDRSVLLHQDREYDGLGVGLVCRGALCLGTVLLIW